MTTRISPEELRARLYAPGARLEDFAAYFRIVPDAANPFRIRVDYDPDKVDLGATEADMRRAALALPVFNDIVRMLRRGQFELKLLGGYDGPVLVAEGDSWFTFPGLDVIGALNDTYAISHLAAAGDTLEQMLDQDEYLDEVRRVGARILLLSGGGNDALGGGDLKTHLRTHDPALTAAQHIKPSFTALLDRAVKNFDRIFRRIAREAPGVTVICHGYDNAIPAKGKWLGKPMAARGIKDAALQRAIAAEMIDRFTQAMRGLAARHPHVVFLDNRRTVADDDWADELHPDPKGFRKVAAKFDAAIRAAAGAPRAIAAAVDGTRRRGLPAPTRTNRGISLHIGLNAVDPGHYGGPQTLYGCHNDARAMAAIAAESGFERRKLLLDKAATVKAVRKEIAAAAKVLTAGDMFLVTYAGHGASVPDYSGDERDDGRDETWCLYDRQLLDDELYEGWRAFAEGVRVLVVSDSCHSGSVIRAAAGGLATVDAAAGTGLRPRTLSDAVRRQVIAAHGAEYRAVVRALGDEAGQAGGLEPKRSRDIGAPLDCTVRLLSGCQDNQTSGDGDENGLFTSRLLQVLEGGFSGDYADFHRAICRLMPENQTPNHWVVGRKDPAFDGQHPFEI